MGNNALNSTTLLNISHLPLLSHFNSSVVSMLYSVDVSIDRYYVAYKPITLPCIFFMFIEMKFIHYHSCVMFAMKSMSMYND